jgi:tetratricopeptide (TPR) repeat protein
MMHLSQGDFAHGAMLFEESLQLAQERNDRAGKAFALLTRGTMTVYQGDGEGARPLLEQSLRLYQGLGNVRYIAIARTMLGLVFLFQRDPARAAALAAQGLAGHWEVGDRTYLHYPFLVIAGALQWLKQPVPAVRLLGAAEVIRETVGGTLGDPSRAMYDQLTARLRAQLSETEYADTWAAGRALTMEQAIRAALEAGASTSLSSAPAIAG